MKDSYINRAGVGGHSNVITANGDILVCDVADLTDTTVHAIQAVHGGTATLQIEYSLDGVNWIINGATFADTAFAAAGACVERTLSDANGMAQRVRQVRLRCSAFGAGGTYTLAVGGTQIDARA